MLSFGKHSGKSFDDVLKCDRSYCLFILKQKTKKGNFKQFQDFLKINIDKIYNKEQLFKHGNINCSDLADYMGCDVNVLSLIENISLNSVRQKKIERNENIPPHLFGQFIDYLIRYEISKITKTKFNDGRTDLLKTGFSSLDLCNFATMVEMIFNKEIYDIEHFDDEFIGNFLEGCEKNKQDKTYENDVVELKTLIDMYINEGIHTILASYKKLQNNYNVTLMDVLNVSISHSLFFNEVKSKAYINYGGEILNNNSYINIVTYIQNKVTGKSNILCNPILGTKNISADADLIIDNELIDIKVSSSIGKNINDFIQLIMYAALYYLKTNIICTKLTIYNPLLGNEYFIEIDLNLLKNILDISNGYWDTNY